MDRAKPALDRIDHRILAELQNNARLSNKELAAIVGLAPSSCLARVQKLVRDGVLAGFHAEVDPAAVGIGIQALVFVRMARHQPRDMQAYWDHLLELPEVLDLYYVAGSHDLVVHVGVRDVDHLRELVAEPISDFEHLGQIETSLIFQHHRSAVLPNYAPEPEPAKAPPSGSKPPRKTGRKATKA